MLAIVCAFSALPDLRRGAGKRHDQVLCLALFTLAISAGCKGFIAISDWLVSYRDELLELFKPAKSRLPYYSTIRRVLLTKTKFIMCAMLLKEKMPLGFALDHFRYFTLARNLALNLYRDHGFVNMAQAQRRAGSGFGLLKALFRMK